MTAFITANMPPLMFVALAVFLISGFPVAFSLAACGITFGFIAFELGMAPASLFEILPLRVFGILQNDTLLAIPFFTFMGLVLQRSGMAEDLLETIGQLFGPIRGGLALAVILVGALLAATTGVVAASVISMGLISLPIMMRYGYNREIATGTITASGTLAQAIPPSLVLIVMADQLGRSVGDMYAGAMVPALLLVVVYVVFIIVLAIFRPSWVPALPPEARVFKEPSGASGARSLLVLTVICVAAGILWSYSHDRIAASWLDREGAAPFDEMLVMSITVGTLTALVLALVNRALGIRMLSAMAERVTFVLIPPLVLIFLVLGTIFLGVATPTEGGAMGAVGALLLAVGRGRLDMATMKSALMATTKLSSFVLFVLIGSTTFSLTFQAVEGPHWVEHLFDKVPGGSFGFLLVVNLIIFALGFFLDFFEIAFILLPLLGPVAEKLGIDLVWFGVMIAVNLQTSFLTPPFGFALFYLRSVAPAADYNDPVNGNRISKVTTAQIYRGSIPYVGLQLLVLLAVAAFPGMVTDRLDTGPKVDPSKIEIKIEDTDYSSEPPPADLFKPEKPAN